MTGVTSEVFTEVLDTEEAAHYLRLSPRTLEDMRHKDTGPAYCEAGTNRRVYRIEDLRAWLVSRRKETSDGVQAG